MERSAIKKLNPKLALPATAIAPVYRSDGSGTNFLFSDYLSKPARSSRTTIGADTSVQWPVGIGAKGNEGVANMTTQTDGAIGYVEYAYAKQNKMAYALLINKARQGRRARAPSRFQAAAANADWAHAAGYYLILTDQAGRRRAGRSPARASSWCTRAAGCGRDRRGAEVLRLGVQERHARWRPTWTTCRCRRR